MKKLYFFAFLSIVTCSAFAQIEVVQNGNVGIETSNPFSKLSFGTTNANVNSRIAFYEHADGTRFRGIGMAFPDQVNFLYGVGIWALTGPSLIPTDTNMQMFVGDNGNVGIGTALPNRRLEVIGDGSFSQLLNTNGGIQNTGPADFDLLTGKMTLKSSGDASLTVESTDGTTGIEFKDPNNTSHIFYSGSKGTYSIGSMGSSVTNKKLHVHGGTSIGIGYNDLTAPMNGLAIEGNVGIGTTDTYGYKLAVNGDLGVDGDIDLSTSVTGNQNFNWPDYVFKKDYILLPLKEVEKHIKEKGHLPNIPSEKEVKEKGSFSLGEMTKKLLEKVEELTLYTIQQEKRIKALEAKLAKKKS